MSTAIQCFDCPNFYALPSSTGFSEESNNLAKNIIKQIREMCESLTMGRPLEETFESLTEVYKECSVANWDGYGANPVSKDSVLEAFKFINLIPASFPMPLRARLAKPKWNIP